MLPVKDIKKRNYIIIIILKFYKKVKKVYTYT